MMTAVVVSIPFALGLLLGLTASQAAVLSILAVSPFVSGWTLGYFTGVAYCGDGRRAGVLVATIGGLGALQSGLFVETIAYFIPIIRADEPLRQTALVMAVLSSATVGSALVAGAMLLVAGAVELVFSWLSGGSLARGESIRTALRPIGIVLLFAVFINVWSTRADSDLEPLTVTELSARMLQRLGG